MPSARTRRFFGSQRSPLRTSATSGSEPYTLLVDVKSSGTGRPSRRSSSSSKTVARTFTSKSTSGSWRLVVTATCAAKWKTASACFTAARSAAWSRTSAISALTRAPCLASSQRRFSSTPGRARLSSTTTRRPCSSSRSARFVPTKPAPPVTRTCRVEAIIAASPRQPPRRQLGRRFVHAVLGLLLREPLGERLDPLLERDARLVPQQLSREPHVGEAVADVAGAELPRHLRLDVRAEHARELLRDLEHGHVAAGADVDRVAVRAVALQRETARARHVRDGDEVAALQPVLEHERRLLVQQARGEDREHARVRVRQRLARAVGVEEAERDCRNVVRAAEDQAQPLLVVLR